MRRELLQLALKTSAMNLSLCVVLMMLPGIDSFDSAGPAAAVWTYRSRTNGVQHWSSLFESCSGPRQSPININSGLVVRDSKLGRFTFNNFYTARGVNIRLINDGYTVTVMYPRGALSLHAPGLGGDSLYLLANLHFHWGSTNQVGSEHTVNGRSFPMEMHLVTWKRAYGNLEKAMTYPDGLQLLAFLFEIRRIDNPSFSALSAALAGIRYPEEEKDIPPFPLLQLLPNTTRYYRYDGSLTTPPCREGVQWTVFNDTIKISEPQMRAFRKLMSVVRDDKGINKPLVDNFRPIQPLSRRKVRANFLAF